MASRRTRFVLISDTHNSNPRDGFRLPKGDVLIHAGDLTNQGTLAELQKTVRWIEDADFELKIVVAGNHDITLDTDFYSEHALYFHNQQPQNPVECQKLLGESSSILWLKHESATVNLCSPNGPRTTFKVFGSPWSPANGMWAFGYEPNEASQLWDKIPLDTDIVVTHTPPKYHCDERKDRRAVGCEVLRNTLWRVRPRLAVCGHVHEGRGVERVCWDLDVSSAKFKEASVERWEDPGAHSKKISLVDLSRKGSRPQQNDGAAGNWQTHEGPVLAPSPVPEDLHSGLEKLTFKAKEKTKALFRPPAAERPESVLSPPVPPNTRGQGGNPPSPRCDLESLSGRLGRLETCIVNAAIMESSWPRSGKKFNKPIVVDIDLPVWGG